MRSSCRDELGGAHGPAGRVHAQHHGHHPPVLAQRLELVVDGLSPHEAATEHRDRQALARDELAVDVDHGHHGPLPPRPGRAPTGGLDHLRRGTRPGGEGLLQLVGIDQGVEDAELPGTLGPEGRLVPPACDLLRRDLAILADEAHEVIVQVGEQLPPLRRHRHRGA